MTNDQDKTSSRKMAAIAMGYGAELVAVILIGLYVGKWIGERYWSAGQWGAIIGCFVGFAGWTTRMIRVQNAANKKK